MAEMEAVVWLLVKVSLMLLVKYFLFFLLLSLDIPLT